MKNQKHNTNEIQKKYKHGGVGITTTTTAVAVEN